MLSIDFGEIVDGCTVRVTDDHMIYAVDLVMVVTGKNINDAGKDLRNLPESIFSSANFAVRNTGGKGNYKTKLVTFQNAIELIMVLPGKMAKDMRKKFSDVISRYLAGDRQMVNELEANAASGSAVNVIAREVLAAKETVTVVENAEDRKRKRYLEDLEIEERIRIMDERRMRTHQMTVNLYKSLCVDNVIDDRARVLFKDNVMNHMMGDFGKPRLTFDGKPADEAKEVKNPHAPITVSTVAFQMGYRLNESDYLKIGNRMSAAYRQRHGVAPSKHEQLVYGAMRPVNSYSEEDRDLMEELIREYAAQVGKTARG